MVSALLLDKLTSPKANAQSIGALLRHLQGQLSSTAELVGIDIVSSFLPESPQGNISYALGDVGEPPAPERTGVFDLTHVRFLLAWALTAGADKVIMNLAGMVHFSPRPPEPLHIHRH